VNALRYAPHYNASTAGVDPDLTHRLGPIQPVLDRIAPVLAAGIHLTDAELQDVIAFVKTGLFDRRSSKENLCKIVPSAVPSRRPVLVFEACQSLRERKDSD
jgi:hypothetical protein